MARVLIEAMAARKPIIATRVDGTPHYLEHGRTALLFESENVDELAALLERLMTDAVLAEKLAAAAFAHVHAELSEERFAERFREMVERTLATR
jgi:glycosyltransferase involved in cell wall biosynthesis